TRLRRDLSFNNFVMVDMNAEIGGTWFANSYPGSCCDAPIHLYAYSFEPKSDWKNTYASQAEILEYLKHVCIKYSLYDKIRLKHQVLRIQFIKSKKLWSVSFKNLENQNEFQEDFNIVILGTGILRSPKIPREFDSFEGPIFHTAKWDHDCNLKNKVLAVIGVGSSGIQVIPELAKIAKKVIIYQRRPSWMLPKENKSYNVLAKLGFQFFPIFQYVYRHWWYSYFEKFWNSMRPGTKTAEMCMTRISFDYPTYFKPKNDE
ncbi:Baeyer-Villiger monooxygenase, partial [Folsomia candida]